MFRVEFIKASNCLHLKATMFNGIREMFLAICVEDFIDWCSHLNLLDLLYIISNNHFADMNFVHQHQLGHVRGTCLRNVSLCSKYRIHLQIVRKYHCLHTDNIKCKDCLFLFFYFWLHFNHMCAFDFIMNIEYNTKTMQVWYLNSLFYTFQPFDHKTKYRPDLLILTSLWHVSLWPYKWPLTLWHHSSSISNPCACCERPLKGHEWTSHFTFIVIPFSLDLGSQWYVGPHLWKRWATLHDRHQKALNTSTQTSTVFLKMPLEAPSIKFWTRNSNLMCLVAPWWPLCQLFVFVGSHRLSSVTDNCKELNTSR